MNVWIAIYIVRTGYIGLRGERSSLDFVSQIVGETVVPESLVLIIGLLVVAFCLL